MATKKAKKNKAKGRGGKREGAGRKLAHESKVITSSISLPPEAWDRLDARRGRLSRSGWVFGQVLKGDLAKEGLAGNPLT